MPKQNGAWDIFMIFIGIIAAIIGIGLHVFLGLAGSVLVALVGWLIYKRFDKTLAWVIWLSLIGHVFLLFGS
jgi:hypothetical protein